MPEIRGDAVARVVSSGSVSEVSLFDQSRLHLDGGEILSSHPNLRGLRLWDHTSLIVDSGTAIARIFGDSPNITSTINGGQLGEIDFHGGRHIVNGGVISNISVQGFFEPGEPPVGAFLKTEQAAKIGVLFTGTSFPAELDLKGEFEHIRFRGAGKEIVMDEILVSDSFIIRLESSNAQNRFSDLEIRGGDILARVDVFSDSATKPGIRFHGGVFSGGVHLHSHSRTENSRRIHPKRSGGLPRRRASFVRRGLRFCGRRYPGHSERWFAYSSTISRIRP